MLLELLSEDAALYNGRLRIYQFAHTIGKSKNEQTSNKMYFV